MMWVGRGIGGDEGKEMKVGDEGMRGGEMKKQE